MERVRREIRLTERFAAEELAAAFDAYRALYHVPPLSAACSPDVFARLCLVVAGDASLAHRHATRLRYRDVPVRAEILAPHTIVFEGEVDEDRMGDW